MRPTCSSNSPPVSKPQIRIPRRRSQHKRLRKPRQNLPKHDAPKITFRPRPRRAISDPVPQQQKYRRRHNRRLGAATIQGVDGERRDDHEGEKERRADPVDGCCRHAVVLRGCR